MSRKVTKIEATAVKLDSPDALGTRKEKVAAYARVSTEKDEQHTSFEAQVDYYKKKILANPGWEFVEVYADDGLSGTSFQRREAFNRMIEDCRAGKITMILTKSISRFARNTVDTIKFIRELRELGIGVMFEKENIWSLDSKGEFLLTVMSSIAQEESRSISENVTWGHRKRMADGKYSVAFGRFMGYEQGKNGEFVINEEEAVHVRRVFSLYLQGYSTMAIADIMTAEGIQPAGGGEAWCGSTVRGMISNEKYKGDALLQKTYTADFLTKKTKRNQGELPQYYVKGGHEAIIDPELFDHVQEVVRERAEADNIFSGQNPFSCKMICSVCGNFFGTRPWHVVDSVWGCRERSKKGHTCSNTHIYDYALWYQLKQLMLAFLNRGAVVATCQNLIQEHVTDDERRKKALNFLKAFRKTDPDTIEFGEEPAHVIRQIIIFPDNHMDVMLIDGMETTFQLKRYTPKLGWRKEEKISLTKAELDRMLAEARAEASKEEPAFTPEEPQYHILTKEIRLMIDSLRRKGLGYKRIADQLHLNVNTVKSYCRRHSEAVQSAELTVTNGNATILLCKNCGTQILQTPGRKLKIFCSDDCRHKWWNAHQDQVTRKSSAMYQLNCKGCGKPFAAYGARNRKYCCHECYIKDRFGV